MKWSIINSCGKFQNSDRHGEIIYELGKGWGGTTWGFEYLGQNGKLKINQGLGVESGIDLKIGRQYEYNVKNGVLKLVETSVGGGSFLTEIKRVNYSVHGNGKLYAGFQEEIGKSFYTGGGLSHSFGAGFNVQMTVKE